jgi:hypothetical protein
MHIEEDQEDHDSNCGGVEFAGGFDLRLTHSGCTAGQR